MLESGILAVFDLADLGRRRLRGGLRVRRGDRAVRRAARSRTRTLPPQLTDTTLLVRPDRAHRPAGRERAAQRKPPARRLQRAAPQAGTGAAGTSTGGRDRWGPERGRWRLGAWRTAGPAASARVPVGRAGGSDPAQAAAPPDHRRPRRTPASTAPSASTPSGYGRDINRLYQEVIQHLAAPDGVDLEITVEINAVKKDGFPDDKARIVSENARTLKFDQSGFEDH